MVGTVTKDDQVGRSGHGLRAMTVAHIREQDGADCETVVFLESARFYRLLRSNPDHDRSLGLLRKALKSGRPVLVRLSAPEGDVIEAVIEQPRSGSPE